MIESYDSVNPHNPNSIAIKWNGSDVKHFIVVIIKEYKPVLVNWIKGTGGGPGAPKNYEDWKEMNGSFFSGYAK